MKPEEDKRLLPWIYRWPLTPAETDACRLRRKNLKALRLAIELNELEAREKAMEAAPAAMKGRRRPSGELAGAMRSDRWPTSGCSRRPDSGPQSQTRLAKACGMPRSWT